MEDAADDGKVGRTGGETAGESPFAEVMEDNQDSGESEDDRIHWRFGATECKGSPPGFYSECSDNFYAADSLYL